MSELLPHVEVFFGEATPALARVYVRVEDGDNGREAVEQLRVTGTVRGPESSIARTLAARMPLRDLGIERPPGRRSARLAEALVPDPCFWLPQRPYWYDVQVDVRRGETLLAEETWELGIRHMGVRARDLLVEGRRWVMRGVATESADPQVVDTAAERAAGLLFRTAPPDTLLEQASRLGVPLAVAVETDAADRVAGRLHGLARWPAVTMAVLPGASDPARWSGQPPRNLLLVQRVGRDQPVRAAPWAGAVLVEESDPLRLVHRTRGVDLPVLGVGRAADRTEDDRASHRETLEQALAPDGGLAGYFEIGNTWSV